MTYSIDKKSHVLAAASSAQKRSTSVLPNSASTSSTVRPAAVPQVSASSSRRTVLPATAALEQPTSILKSSPLYQQQQLQKATRVLRATSTSTSSSSNNNKSTNMYRPQNPAPGYYQRHQQQARFMQQLGPTPSSRSHHQAASTRSIQPHQINTNPASSSTNTAVTSSAHFHQVAPQQYAHQHYYKQVPPPPAPVAVAPVITAAPSQQHSSYYSTNQRQHFQHSRPNAVQNPYQHQNVYAESRTQPQQPKHYYRRQQHVHPPPPIPPPAPAQQQQQLQHQRYEHYHRHEQDPNYTVAAPSRSSAHASAAPPQAHTNKYRSIPTVESRSQPQPYYHPKTQSQQQPIQYHQPNQVYQPHPQPQQQPHQRQQQPQVKYTNVLPEAIPNSPSYGPRPKPSAPFIGRMSQEMFTNVCTSYIDNLIERNERHLRKEIERNQHPHPNHQQASNKEHKLMKSLDSSPAHKKEDLNKNDVYLNSPKKHASNRLHGAKEEDYIISPSAIIKHSSPCTSDNSGASNDSPAYAKQQHAQYHQKHSKPSMLPNHLQPESVFFSITKPSISTYAYISRIISYTQCSPSVFIVMLIYLQRIGEINNRLKVTSYNLHRLLITSLMLACKWVDDVTYTLQHYSKIGGIPTTKEMERLEMQFLKYLNFDMHVPVEDYYTMQHDLDGLALNL